MTMNIRVKKALEVPDGTILVLPISETGYITLARKDRGRGIILLFTCPEGDIDRYNLIDPKVWTEYTPEELKVIYNAFVKKK